MARSDEIRDMPSCLRMASYLQTEVKLAAVGARLRVNGRADETWTSEEEAEFAAACDEVDVW